MMSGHPQVLAPPDADQGQLQAVSRPRLRVLLVENHPRIRQGLAAILGAAEELDVTEERIDPAQIMREIRRQAPDVISLAVQLDGEGGLGLLDRLRREVPGSPVIVLTMQRSAAFADRALHRGASGVVLKDYADSELVPAVQAAALGETYVSPRIFLS